MDKAVLATVCFVAGAAFGFSVGYFLKKERENEYVEPIPVEMPKAEQKQEPEKSKEEIYNIKPARLASKPGEVGINYTAYVKDLKYKQETQSPPDDDPDDGDVLEEESDEEEDMDMTKYEETFEERMERQNQQSMEHAEQYKREHKGKIELMTADDWDSDFIENDYEREDLYYFTESDVITNEEGERMDEEETVGLKPRQVGWMQSPDDEIYIRNHVKEMEYRLIKEHCSVEDWF